MNIINTIIEEVETAKWLIPEGIYKEFRSFVDFLKQPYVQSSHVFQKVLNKTKTLVELNNILTKREGSKAFWIEYDNLESKYIQMIKRRQKRYELLSCFSCGFIDSEIPLFNHYWKYDGRYDVYRFEKNQNDDQKILNKISSYIDMSNEALVPYEIQQVLDEVEIPNDISKHIISEYVVSSKN
jgi:hypothetical protein